MDINMKWGYNGSTVVICCNAGFKPPFDAEIMGNRMGWK